MIDARFYRARGPKTVADLFKGLETRGDAARLLHCGAALTTAGPDELAYFEGKGEADIATAAGALVIAPENADRAPRSAVLIVSRRPRGVFAKAAADLVADRPFQMDGTAIDSSAEIEPGAVIAPGVVIGPEARIGANAEIGPNAVIGPGVAIGRRTRVGAGASIRCALIGDDVKIGPGAAIGEPGFGVAAGPDGPVDFPHVGRVVIQDRVRLGACVTVDRGVFDDTIISEDAKIDNLCHIAHNVVIGRGVLIAAFGGISGSSRIEDGAVLGGRVGLADHLVIGKGAQIAAGAAVLGNVPAGARWAGYPAKAFRTWARELAWIARAAGKRDVGE